MSPELFGTILRSYGVVALGWLTCAFLMCGLMMFQRKGPSNPDWGRRTMLTCLFIWPLALVVQIVAWLTDACWWVFNPDSGPVATLAAVLKHASRNYLPPHPEVPAATQPEQVR